MTTLSNTNQPKKKKQKFNRAKEKRETQDLIDDALYGEYDNGER